MNDVRGDLSKTRMIQHFEDQNKEGKKVVKSGKNVLITLLNIVAGKNRPAVNLYIVTVLTGPVL